MADGLRWCMQVWADGKAGGSGGMCDMDGGCIDDCGGGFGVGLPISLVGVTDHGCSKISLAV